MTQKTISEELIGELRDAMNLINIAGNFTETAENIANLIALDNIEDELREECECLVAAINDLVSLPALSEYL